MTQQFLQVLKLTFDLFYSRRTLKREEKVDCLLKRLIEYLLDSFVHSLGFIQEENVNFLREHICTQDS